MKRLNTEKLSQLREKLPKTKRSVLRDAPITNQTVVEHRKDILKSAKKFVYPLQHSKNRVVLITGLISLFTLVLLSVYTYFSLYRQQSTSSFSYSITKILPLPVARLDGRMIPYENYLFHLRHTLHYKRTQENFDIDSKVGKSQLDGLKQMTLQKVLREEMVKSLARDRGITINRKEVDVVYDELRASQSTDDQSFRGVLKNFYDWSESDLRRALAPQVLRTKVLRAIESDKTKLADQALAEIKSGKDFAEVAKQYSEDANTKDAAGVLTKEITKNSRDLSLSVRSKIFDLKAGEVSEVIYTDDGVEIIKVLETDGSKIKAAHIRFNYRDFDKFVDEQLQGKKLTKYVKI
jgi:PPIC-type PPIASE domain/SurA N-terminal domain